MELGDIQPITVTDERFFSTLKSLLKYSHIYRLQISKHNSPYTACFRFQPTKGYCILCGNTGSACYFFWQFTKLFWTLFFLNVIALWNLTCEFMGSSTPCSPWYICTWYRFIGLLPGLSVWLSNSRKTSRYAPWYLRSYHTVYIIPLWCWMDLNKTYMIDCYHWYPRDNCKYQGQTANIGYKTRSIQFVMTVNG